MAQKSLLKFSVINFFILSFLYSKLTIIHCGLFINGVNDKSLKVVSILIEKDRIIDINEGYTDPGPEDVLIDLNSYTVLPGLMDMHTHLSSESNPNKYMENFTLDLDDYAYQSILYAKRTLFAGFTTVRDLGGPINNSLRDAIKKNQLVGPRIFSAGKAITTTGGHTDPTNGVKLNLTRNPGPSTGVVNGVDEAIKAVRQQYKNGADLIKITATGSILSLGKSEEYPQFKEDEIIAIVETAADYGMHVAAQAHGPEGIKRAIRAGVKSIEHGTLMDDEAINLMKKYSVFYVPTILGGEFISEKAKKDSYYPDLVKQKAKNFGPKIRETFKKAYLENVKIAFGTDSGVSYHGENGKEFMYMVEAGMSPMEAIKSATISAAELLGIKDTLGTIEIGKIADIIAIKGNPLEDISTLQNVKFVMKNGIIYKNLTN